MIAEHLAGLLVGEYTAPDPEDPCADFPSFLNAPSNVSTYTYAGSKIGITLTVTETLAQVRLYRNGSLAATYPANTNNIETGFTSGTLEVSHYRSDETCGEVESSLVEAGA